MLLKVENEFQEDFFFKLTPELFKSDLQGITDKIQFKTDVQSADWKSSDNRWHIVTEHGKR